MRVLLSTGSIKKAPKEIGISEDLQTVVVKDARGNPIFVAMQQDEDNIYAVTAQDPVFESVVQELGLMKRVAAEAKGVFDA